MTEILTIRLDRREKRALQRLAGASGVSSYVRGLIQAQLRAQPQSFLAQHKQWLATQPILGDGAVAVEWFKRNRR